MSEVQSISTIPNVQPADAQAQANPATLTMSHLGKRYGKRWVVKDVSFAVQQGQVVGLLGPIGQARRPAFIWSSVW